MRLAKQVAPDASTHTQFLAHLRACVRHPRDCWLWPGAVNNQGYGYSGHGLAHRRAWELLVEPIASGLELDHLCKVPLCVNPHHLEPVRPWVNNMRSNSGAAINARKTACKSGHPFDAANTYYPERDGGHTRQCRTCRRLAERARLARLRRGTRAGSASRPSGS